ncbi:ABC transporter permease [Nocardioides cheoyonin]|uniref:ABC transporter permease n=1 Tax=Nocardioides cheoyonin TaxID=3156615 RepID=UPI0032B5976D
MLRFALRSLFARKTRLAMSSLAIVLGVAFLAGVLTFSHGLSATFDNIVKGTIPDAMIQVKGRDEMITASQPSTLTLSPAQLARVRALPEVGAAQGGVEGYGVSLLSKEGKLVGGQGAPTFANNYAPIDNLLGEPMMRMDSGRPPTRTGEIMMDKRSAERGHYRVGDTVRIVTPGPQPLQRLRLVGINSFTGGGVAGAVILMLDTDDAQRLFLGGRDAYGAIELSAAPGVSQQQLVDAVRPLVPAGFEAVTGDKVAADTQSSIDSILGVISTFLLVFAGIAVLVCALIIVNTFTILVAQRTRELAVVRALGASRRQITWSVLLEAVLMAVVATGVGIAAGWALARGLAAVFRGLGLEIAGDTLTLTASSITACVAVGVLVTALAAYLPARRAGRIAPVAAMRVDATPAPSSLRRRLYVGVPALALGALCAVAGLVGAPGNDTAWIGVGAVIWIVTTATLSGLLGRPFLSLLTRLFARLFGATGRIAGENAQRDPRRTGATASALMIGLALVSTIGVLAASLNRTVDDIVDEDFAADFIVQGPSYAPFPTAIGDAIASVPGVGVMARQQVAYGELHGRSTAFTANASSFWRIYSLDMVAGRQAVHGDEALVFEEVAREHGWHVGSTFRLTFPGAKALRLTVAGIAKESAVTGPITIPLSEISKAGIERQDSYLSIDAAPGTDPSVLHRRLDTMLDALPVVSVQDKQEFADSIRGQVNQLLYLIYGLLALAVVIAVFGIVNTLGLSVIERTRELGLLRAIGLSRPQLRGMVTLESVAIAALGAVLGLVLGLAFGIALRQSLASDISSLGVPLTQLVLFLVAAVVVGVVAAAIPAVRASRLDVLKAIATE